MKKQLIISGLVILIIVGLFIFQKQIDNRSNLAVQSVLAHEKFEVYKTATCGCCVNYVGYLKKMGFEVIDNNISQEELNQFKESHSIPHEMYSCHTTVVGDYVIEGHIPIEAIERLLMEKPDVYGIAMPGMPAGSPGMGGGKAEPFKISILKESGAEDWISL